MARLTILSHLCFNWISSCKVFYFRRRYLRRSLSLLAAIFTVVFIIKLQHLIGDLDSDKSKLNVHWSSASDASHVPERNQEDVEEDRKARIRFAEFGIDLIEPDMKISHAETERRFSNIQLLHINDSAETRERGDELIAKRAMKFSLELLSPEEAKSMNLSFESKPHSSSSSAARHVYLTVLVLSKPSNVLLRQAIRKTWGYEAMDIGVCVRFVVGREETWNEIVDKEERIHHDVIAVDEEDTYEYLPNKVFDGIAWVLRQEYRPKYVMKVDDDTYLDLVHLLQELQGDVINSSQILGAVCSDAAVSRDSGDKWAVSLLEYPFPFYPTYANGGGYVMTLAAASLLLNTRSMTFDWIHLEDVYITGMLAKKAGLTHVSHPAFSYWSSPKATPCDFVLNKRITSVNHTEKEFYSIYSGIMEINRLNNSNQCKAENNIARDITTLKTKYI